MDLTETKEIFYKRFGASGRFLRYTFTGALCPLLGHAEVLGAPFLSCTLSMGVGMFARAIDGGKIVSQSVGSDRRFEYALGAPPKLYRGRDREIALIAGASGSRISGAEILYKSTVPPFLGDKREFALSLVRSVAGETEHDAHSAASIAARDSHIEPYLALSYAKSGYSTLVDGGAPVNVPLPLTGYKIILACCRRKIPNRSDKIYGMIEKLKRRFPDLNSVSQLTAEHAYYARSEMKARSAEIIRHLAEENTRIKSAVSRLKKCDVKPLFAAMNASQRSMEMSRYIGGDMRRLAEAAKSADGAAAVRCIENGAVIIAEEDMVDSIVRAVRVEFENEAGYRPNFCIAAAI